MMGRRSGQIGMQIVDVEMMIPQNHLLRKIDRMVRFEFIYELLAPYYPSNGRPSVIVRIPMIPCVNDDMQNLAETCEFASKLDGVRGVMLLRYNPMAESKYIRAKSKYTSFGTETQSIQQVKTFCDELNGKLSKSGFVFCKD